MVGYFYYCVVDFLKQEFKRLKDNLKKCMDRREKATKSGAPQSKLPQCKYFTQLLSLTDKTVNKPTESNVSIIISEGEDLIEESPLELQPTTSTPSKTQSVSQSCTNGNIGSRSQFHDLEAQPSSTSAKKSKPLLTNTSDTSQPKKSHAELAHVVDSMLVKALQDMQNNESKSDGLNTEDDEDSLYCRNLIPIFRELPLKKKR